MRNPLDAAISFFSPQKALKRTRARNAMRIYDGASFGPRSTGFRALHTSANAEIQSSLRPLRDRVRELARNSPYIPRMLDIFVAHAIGTGLRPVPRTGADKLDIRVEKLWREWNIEADVEGVQSFDAQQALALRSCMESGEVVGRFVDQELKTNRRSKVPMSFQLLESDFIDSFRQGIYEGNEDLGLTADTLRSRLGVGLGKYDFRTGLWLLPWHPGEVTTYNMRPGISRFHPREEVLHLYKLLRPGQVRGVPWFAPILMTARDLADFIDACVVKARVEACFAAFVENSGDEIGDQIMDSFPDPVSPRGPDLTMLEPGMIKELKAGQKIQFAQPTSATQVEPMLMHPLMAMSAAVGCTYDQVTGDLRGANYSSLRAGKIEFRVLVEQTQKLMLIPRLCQPVWDRFISRAILAGELRERADGYPCDWITPAWEAVNPQTDNDADMGNVRAGRVTPQDFIASYGSDWRKVQDDFAEFYKRADSLGLVFDIDARTVTKAGQVQPPTAEESADMADKKTADDGGGANGGDDLDKMRGVGGRSNAPFRLVH